MYESLDRWFFNRIHYKYTIRYAEDEMHPHRREVVLPLSVGSTNSKKI